MLPCVEADERGNYLRIALRHILQTNDMKHEVNVDCIGLYNKIFTFCKGRDYRLMQTTQKIRESFNSEELDVLRWIQGFANLVDALTKHNLPFFKLLKQVMKSALL